MDMFRLCRSDNMGLRSTAPSIMLRLDKVQECYDFIKWWYTGTDGQYDWADASLPYLNIKDADVFEPCDVFISEFPDLGQGVALVLLKIKLLMDLQSLQEASRSVGDNVPQEILDMIREKAVGPAVSSRPEIMEQPDQSQNIAAMRKQVHCSINMSRNPTSTSGLLCSTQHPTLLRDPNTTQEVKRAKCK